MKQATAVLRIGGGEGGYPRWRWRPPRQKRRPDGVTVAMHVQWCIARTAWWRAPGRVHDSEFLACM